MGAKYRPTVQGSTFTVRLSLAPDGPQPSLAPAPVTPPQTESPPKAACRRVLIVDDNEDIIHSFEILLNLWGHQVQTALDGPTALEIAHTFQPEVILLDIGLPGMDGYEVARRLRAAYGPDIKLIALTGYGQAQDKQRAREADFDQHLTKPPSIKLLKDLLAGNSLNLHERN